MGDRLVRMGHAVAWLVVGSGVVATLAGVSALSWLAAQVGRVASWPTEPEPVLDPRELRIERRARAEHRKRLRRASTDPKIRERRERLKRCAMFLEDTRKARANFCREYNPCRHGAPLLLHPESYAEALRVYDRSIRGFRDSYREAELSYAIACSAAGAVPGGER